MSAPCSSIPAAPLPQVSIAAAPVAATFVLFTVASLVPILNGANLKEAFGPFKPDAELLNGRLVGMGCLRVWHGRGLGR
jgi:hypothetical protein